MQIRETEAFSEWLTGLRDIRAKVKVLTRIDRLRRGSPGDVKPVGDGVSEMRIDYGPGYRVYYVQRGQVLTILLCGGDKTTQRRDIEKAKDLAGQLED